MINAQEWLDKNYPQDGVCQRKTNDKNWSHEEGWNNYGKTRTEIIKLDIHGQNLEGELGLSDFINCQELDCSNNRLSSLELKKSKNLKKLDCSRNQLTKVNLVDCSNLLYLYVHDNKFTNTSFLKNLSHKENLKELIMWGNSWIIEERLDFLNPFVGLIELNIEKCLFFGSLKPLKKMTKLRMLSVGDTNIEEGLEYLPESCEKIYCDFDHRSKKKSVKIATILGKYLEKNDDDIWYYNLIKWREEKQNGIALVIPLERLTIIKGDIKTFLKRWDDDKLRKLEGRARLKLYGYVIIGTQWIGRITSVVGGSLLLVGASDRDNNDNPYTQIGGLIAVISPFIEVTTSQLEKRFYEERKIKLEEFIRDSEKLLNNCCELKGMLEPIRASSLGKINEALNNLKKEVNDFLEKYDANRDGEIDDDEWIKAKDQLAQDLRREKEEIKGEQNKQGEAKKSKLERIAESIKSLQKEIIKYRQYFYYGTSEGESYEIEEEGGEKLQIEVDYDQKSEVESRTEIFQNNSSCSLLLDNKKGKGAESIELGELQTQIQDNQTLQVPHVIARSSKI